jgi:hypothetical protein
MGKGGLSFLQKKSWNTSNLSNVEKVWKAEKKQREEARRVEQLQREIEQERQREGLRAMQKEAGLLPATQERMGWMVGGGGAARKLQEEEFLLGKEFEIKQETRVEKKEDDVGVDVDVDKLREDPLLAMMVREREEKIHKQKAANAQRARHNKDMTRDEHRGNKYGLLSQSSSRDIRGKRSRSRSYERRKRSRSRSRSRDYKGYDRDSRKYSTRSRERSRSRSRDRDRKYNSRSKRPRSRSRSYEKSSRKYRDESSHYSRKKYEDKKPYGNGNSRPSKLSQEEREEKLRQMQMDAQQISSQRTQKEMHERAIKEKEEMEWRNRKNPDENPANFLQDMSKKVFLETEDKLEDRLKKNRHYLLSSHRVREEDV